MATWAFVLAIVIMLKPPYKKTDALNKQEVQKTESKQAAPVVQPQTAAPVAAAPVPVVPTTPDEWMDAVGIVSSDRPAVNFIMQHESGWCPTKWQDQHVCPDGFANIYAGDETDGWRGFGLCQSTPAIKMATAGDDWRTNPVTQLKWCNAYAQSRHGGWWNAYNYWVAHHNW